MSNKINRSKQGRSVTPTAMRKKQEQESYELTPFDRALPYLQVVILFGMAVLVVLFLTKVVTDLTIVWVMASLYFVVAALRDRHDRAKKKLNLIFLAIYSVIAIVSLIRSL